MLRGHPILTHVLSVQHLRQHLGQHPMHSAGQQYRKLRLARLGGSYSLPTSL